MMGSGVQLADAKLIRESWSGDDIWVPGDYGGLIELVKDASPKSKARMVVGARYGTYLTPPIRISLRAAA